MNLKQIKYPPAQSRNLEQRMKLAKIILYCILIVSSTVQIELVKSSHFSCSPRQTNLIESKFDSLFMCCTNRCFKHFLISDPTFCTEVSISNPWKVKSLVTAEKKYFSSFKSFFLRL